ncbi:TIGR01459 family HAD-type hydrolase [Oceanicola sp. S124]|uniref:TIGR01459 family HAD-type hydrolase n=1 Tax=Oceanicola sp. S124 TaxID=1042378 RepID=UPI00025596F8|nr:TIGR01459 family HAD-type hydrolase [Oceanicola sp. S124]
MTRIVQSLAEIASDYDAFFVDLWGCVHNGVTALPEAVAALQEVRKTGKKVVLVTNSPRPRAQVEIQLDGFGVARDSWDIIATSGDSARAAMYNGTVGSKVFHIGEPGDDPFFHPLEIQENPVEITRVPLDEAEGVVCTGPFDPMAEPAVLRPELLLAKTKGLKLLCANPDIVVDRGEVREWCAGAVAQLYTEMGGESLYFGKPHPPIYDLARLRLGQLGPMPSEARILAIGDGIQTDVKGGMGEGIDTLFITGGLALEETKTTDQPDPEALEAFIEAQQMTPTYAIGFLR